MALGVRLDVLSLATRLARLPESFGKGIVVDLQLRDLVVLRVEERKEQGEEWD